MKKSLICALLVLILVLGFSTFALAEQTDLNAILDSAAVGTQIDLNSDIAVKSVSVPEGVTLNLNGYTLEASYVSCFGNIIDSTGTGLLKVPENHFLIQQNNVQLPVKDSGGYRFFALQGFNTQCIGDTGVFAFQPLFSAGSHQILNGGTEKTGVTVNVRVSWKSGDGTPYQYFVYKDSLLTTFLSSYNTNTGKFGKMFTLTISAPEKYEDLTFEAVVRSETGVELAAPAVGIGDSIETPVEPEPLISTDEFTYGSYFDHDRFQGNTGTRLTSGDYGKIRAADALLPAQDITIQVTDTNLTDYKVTLGFYTKEGVYTGRTGILPMTDGQLTIKASSMSGAYFRVNVYLYNGKFTKVPESAVIEVYGGEQQKPPVVPEEPEAPDTVTDLKITILGDSISTGGYVNTLGSLTGATIQNLSVSGKVLAGGLTGMVGGIDQDADVIIIFGGTNDYWHKTVTIGDADSTDSKTYVGALKYILNDLKTNHPDAQYLFVFPPDQTFGGNPSSTDFGKGTLDDFRAAFLTFCQTNSVSYVNLGDTDFDPAKHSGDGVHPNATGHQIIADAIYNAILKWL